MGGLKTAWRERASCVRANDGRSGLDRGDARTLWKCAGEVGEALQDEQVLVVYI